MELKQIVQLRTSSYMSSESVEPQLTTKQSPRRVKALWLDSQRLASSDFRARSGRGCIGVLLALWFAGLTGGLVVLCVFTTFKYQSTLRTACLPDDSFNLDPGTYQYWSNSGFFQITLGFGHLTFTQAKAIDVIWDVVIGRGGQGLLAYISWHAFVRYVTTSMEIQPVTFDTYCTIFLQNESLITAIPRTIRDFSRRRGLHSRFAMVFIVLTMIFVLVFPTLGGAMTGYSGNVEAYVPDASGNNLLFRSFRPLYYVIHDGKRVNLTDEYEVLPTKDDLSDPVAGATWAYNAHDLPCTKYPDVYYKVRCIDAQRILNVSAYVGQYRISRNVSSIFAGVILDPPLLNITSYSSEGALPGSPGLNYSTWLDPSGPAVESAKSRSWSVSGERFFEFSIAQSGVCQATKDYKWGFSFIQLIIMLILLWLWTFGIAIMSTTSKLTMLQRGREDVAGEHKAVFELADAMHTQLTQGHTEEARNTRQATESDLRRRIKKDLNGGSIAYDTTLLNEHGAPAESNKDWTVSAWARRELWWLIALAATIVVDVLVIRIFVVQFTRADLYFFFALPLALGFAMYVGTTHQSRAMVFFWAVLVVCALPAVILGVVIRVLTLMR